MCPVVLVSLPVSSASLFQTHLPPALLGEAICHTVLPLGLPILHRSMSKSTQQSPPLKPSPAEIHLYFQGTPTRFHLSRYDGAQSFCPVLWLLEKHNEVAESSKESREQMYLSGFVYPLGQTGMRTPALLACKVSNETKPRNTHDDPTFSAGLRTCGQPQPYHEP